MANDNVHTLINRTPQIKAPNVSDYSDQVPGKKVSSTWEGLLLRPDILSGYIQLFLNLCIVLSVFWASVRFILMLKNDVDSRIQQLVSIERIKLKKCERDYIQNNCDPMLRVPALEEQCEQWLQCMHNTELAEIGSYTFMSAKLWAQALAEVINAFSKEISIRSLAFLFICSCSVIVVTNVAFAFYR